MANHSGMLSIGALAKATGVPADTLRTWERRYGFPVAVRTPSGHRRYSLETLDQLRLVTEALEAGHRPADALSADKEHLLKMLGRPSGSAGVPAAAVPAAVDDVSSNASGGQRGAEVPVGGVDQVLEEWFERVLNFEGRALERSLRMTWNNLDALTFLEQYLGPFLRGIGQRWAAGELGVRHEHFASERLREFLSAQWRTLCDGAVGPRYVLAAPSGERHVLGLHLVAVVVALSGGRVLFLGADTPMAEVAWVAQAQSAEAVLLSAATGTDSARLRADIAVIRADLPAATGLLVGGGGFVGLTDVPGVTHLATLRDLEHWLGAAARQSAPPQP